jgi:hypothetical protein
MQLGINLQFFGEEDWEFLYILLVAENGLSIINHLHLLLKLERKNSREANQCKIVISKVNRYGQLLL